MGLGVVGVPGVVGTTLGEVSGAVGLGVAGEV
mgnify:CR=1 FL=1